MFRPPWRFLLPSGAAPLLCAQQRVVLISCASSSGTPETRRTSFSSHGSFVRRRVPLPPSSPRSADSLPLFFSLSPYIFNACLHRLRSPFLPSTRHFLLPLLFVLLVYVSSGPYGPHPLRFLGATNSCGKDLTPDKAAYRGECLRLRGTPSSRTSA